MNGLDFILGFISGVGFILIATLVSAAADYRDEHK